MQQLYTPPILADEEQTQTARLMYVIMGTIMLAVTLIAPAWLFAAAAEGMTYGFDCIYPRG